MDGICIVQCRSPSFTGLRLVLFHILHRNRNTGHSDLCKRREHKILSNKRQTGYTLIPPPPPILGSRGDGRAANAAACAHRNHRSTVTRSHHLHHLMPLSIHQHRSATIMLISRASLKIQSHSPPVHLSWSLRTDATLTDIVASSNEGFATLAIVSLLAF